MKEKYNSVNKNALKIAMIYAGISVIWILLSDKILHSLPLGYDTLHWMSILKGWVFVILTAILLYQLTKKFIIDANVALFSQVELEKRWHFALDVAGDGLWDWHLNEGRFDYAGNWTELLENCGKGSDRSETWLKAVYPDDAERLQNAINDHINGLSESFEIEHRIVSAGDKTKWLLARGLATERGRDGKAGRFSGVVIDITKQKEVEHELRIAATAFDSNEAKMITSSDKKIIRVNRAFSTITGYSQKEVIGQDPSILKSGIQSADFYHEMWRSIHDKGYWQGEIWNKRKNGQEYPEWLRINVVKDDHGEVTNYIASFNDVSDLKQARRQIDHLSHFDALTHLPNKTSMMSMLDKVMASANTTSKYTALMFVDLKNFKALNSTMGHSIGDVILAELSSRLTESSNHIAVARYGGDVFSILLNNIGQDMDDAAYNVHQYAKLIIAKVSDPIVIDEFQYRADIRVGVTVFHPADSASEEILKQAEMAIDESKGLDTNNIVFFNDQMQAKIERRFNLETKLREAIPEQLFLTFQLQVDRKQRPVGAEVLLRWLDPQEGIVSPAEFIPVAEKTGMINEIGDWVLHTACKQISTWSSDPLLSELIVSVNVSVKQFMQPDFIAGLNAVILETDISAARLKLEMTESIFVEDYEIIISKMDKIKSMGIKISLDDFGTGFSSLAYLKRLPIDELKIDQSFVKDLMQSNENKAIVESIITLGQSLKISVIAEGVETKAQRDRLIEMGCDNFQGFLFSRPSKVDELESILADWPSCQ